MGDFNTKQPKPQSRPSTQFDSKAAQTPKTGFTEAPRAKDADKGPGPGVPANHRKIR